MLRDVAKRVEYRWLKVLGSRVVANGLPEVNPLDALDTWESTAKNICGGLQCQTQFLFNHSSQAKSALAEASTALGFS